MTPLVSIVIPCYNAARCLPAALDSVLAQSHSLLEIIAVDDGSTDGTPGILNRYASTHPKIFRILETQGRGAAAARNRGFAASSGDFIKFLDADDLISPNMVAQQVAALIGRQGYIAHGEWARFLIDPNEAVFAPHPGWHDSDNPVQWICETWEDTEPMYQCGMFLIPRSILEKAHLWDERLSLIDDFEFFTRLVLASDGIVHTPAAKLYYRSNQPGSLSAQKSRQAWESAVLSTRLAVDHLLATEDTLETRRLSANMLQKLLYSFYPEHADLRSQLVARIAALGGSDLTPGGGAGFQKLARFTGWRFAARVRYLVGRRPH